MSVCQVGKRRKLAQTRAAPAITKTKMEENLEQIASMYWRLQDVMKFVPIDHGVFYAHLARAW
eukprot:1527717-Lingulodinium_polyedra.AAC.1